MSWIQTALVQRFKPFYAQQLRTTVGMAVVCITQNCSTKTTTTGDGDTELNLGKTASGRVAASVLGRLKALATLALGFVEEKGGGNGHIERLHRRMHGNLHRHGGVLL